jgi:hypothetical protein
MVKKVGGKGERGVRVKGKGIAKGWVNEERDDGVDQRIDSQPHHNTTNN